MTAKIKTFLLCIGMLAAADALAAEPIALWDGEFSTLKDFSLTSDGGNTIENNQISITGNSTGGVVYTGPNSSLNNCTFIIKGSGLNLNLEANQYLLALHQNILGGGNGDASYNKVGVALGSQNAGVRGIWENGYYSQNFHRADPFTNGGDIVINIQTSGGVYVYEIVSDEEMGLRKLALRSKNTDLKSSNTNYKGFSIGGVYEKSSSTLAPAIGWTISKMAVFGQTLTEDEILGYSFPSEVIKVVGDTTVSKLNELVSTSPCNRPIVSLSNGATIDIDEPFAPKSSMAVVSSGKVTLRADSMPDASYFSKVDFSGVHTLIRSWLNPGVVGFNFNANAGRNGEGTENGASDTSLALEIGPWYANGSNPNGSSVDMFADGLTRLEWKSNNVYAESGGIQNGTFIQGYLDDGGNGVSITLSGVPYEKYDVIIYCSTDDANKSFQPKNVNGTNYTWDSASGQTVEGTGTWGLASAAAGKAVYGANTLRINDLSGPLSIKGGGSGDNARGCISAFQIMPHGTSTSPMMTVEEGVASVEWTKAKWNVPSPPASGNVIITVYGHVELVVDVEVNLSSVVVEGEGSLKIVPSENVRFAADSVSSAIPLILGNERVAVATISAPVKFLYKTAEISSSIGGRTYTAGEGSESEAVAIVHNGGSVLLDGGSYYFCESYNGPQTTVVFKDANVEYSDACGVGMATYEVGGTSRISAPRLILSQGADGKTATMIVRDSAVVNVSGTTNGDSNQSSVMFGHWNGPSSFTIQDDATFSAASDVLVGKTANRQVINLDGGIFSASGIKAAGYASWENQLNLNGGILELGQTGITSYAQGSHIQVAVLSCSELRASAAELPISQNVTINSEASLALRKVDGIESAIVKVSGTIGGSGSIDVGAGITLHLGVNRPEEIEISVEEGGALALTLQNKAEVPEFKVASQPSSVVLYDIDGVTLIENANVAYDAERGTITIKPPVNTWTVSGENLSFDSASNWTLGVPQEDQDLLIDVASDATLRLDRAYDEISSLTISGSGVVEFSGEGSLNVQDLYLVNGVTLKVGENIEATSIILAEGTVLRIVEKAEGALISGAGSVETYGRVVLGRGDGSANTLTGGITVKPGSLLEAAGPGAYGEYSPGWNCGDQRRVIVEDGGTVDINNIANQDSAVALAIAGKGIELGDGVFAGAVRYSGESAIGGGSRQISSVTLNGDAMVDVGAGWGLVHSGWGNARLDLSGHTLTVRGKQDARFPVANVNTREGDATTGALVIDGAILELMSNNASNFAGVKIEVKGASKVNFATAPSAVGSLVFRPSNGGTVAEAWNLPSGLVPCVYATNLDASNLIIGDTVILVSVPDAVELSSENIAVNVGGRFAAQIETHAITATLKELMPLIHYNFDSTSLSVDNSAAEGSVKFSSWGDVNGNGAAASMQSKNGRASRIYYASDSDRAVPWWDRNNAGRSPVSTGTMTVTSVIKPMDASAKFVIWALGAAHESPNTGVALAIEDESTLSVIKFTGTTPEILVAVSGIEKLVGAYHFVAARFDENGTSLTVDGKTVVTTSVAPLNYGQQGQLGSTHGANPVGYSKQRSAGVYFDDFAIYDTLLTPNEMRKIWREMVPQPFVIRIR